MCVLYVSRTQGYVVLFNDTATTEIYALSLHDALPICLFRRALQRAGNVDAVLLRGHGCAPAPPAVQSRCPHRRRSEEHTSELQSRQYHVCRLLLETKHSSLFYSCSRASTSLQRVRHIA